MDDKNREDSAVQPVSTEDIETGRFVEEARKGDKRAFGHLVRIYQKKLFRFIYGLTGSFDMTEDIVQESFVKAYQALERFKPGHAFYPWIATIARNTAFNQMQREKRKESLDQKEETGFDIESSEADPLALLQNSENQKRFYTALKSMPENQRKVFVLRHFEEMDYADIASALEIPTGTVDSRLYRARQYLIEQLKDLL